MRVKVRVKVRIRVRVRVRVRIRVRVRVRVSLTLTLSLTLNQVSRCGWLHTLRSEVSAAKACALPVSTWSSEEVVSKWCVVGGAW